MKQKMIIGIFVITLIAVGMLNILFPNAATISELENRTLATIPELTKENFFSGDYFSGLESYYSDHFFNREGFVMISQNINEYKGIKGDDHVELVMMDTTDQFVQEEETPSGAAPKSTITEVIKKEIVLQQQLKKRIETNNDLNQLVRNFAKSDIEFFIEIEPVVLQKADNDTVLEQMAITNDGELSGNKQNGILVINDECYELFGYSKGALNVYADAINNFAELLPEGDKVYSAVVPGKIEFVKSDKYRNMAESHADSINYMNEQFNELITPVNIYTPIQEHSDEYLYFRSDHHWTALGAYYAYTAFAKTIGDIPYELEDFEREDVEGFLGTLYNRTLSRTVKENPDTVQIYHPFVENTFTIYTANGGALDWEVINMAYAKISNKYMVFISGDNPLSVIDTELDNGKKIMIFKDSYGNAFVPWLMNHYDEIHIIDPRHYEKGAISYALENDIHEFMFFNYNVVIAGHTGFANNIYKVSY